VSEEKNWFCVDCRLYNTKEYLIREHYNLLGHRIIRRTPLAQRIIYTTKGNVVVTVEGEKYGVFPVLCTFHDVFAHIDTDDSLSVYSVMAENKNWQFNGTAVLSGNLENLSKKLSHLRPKITVKQLEQLFVSGIKQGKYVETNTNNIVQLLVCRNTDLKLKPINQRSKWIICTSHQIKKLEPNLEEKSATAHKRARAFRLKVAGE